MQILSNHFSRSRRKKTRNTGGIQSQVDPRPIPHPILDWKYLRPPSPKFPFFQASTDFSYNSSPKSVASWLADLCLLAYDEPPAFKKSIAHGGLNFIDYIHNKGVEVYVVESSSCLIVAFRGTQINKPLELLIDLKTDFSFKPEKSIHYSGKIHHGFENALDKVWNPLLKILKNKNNIQFTGHSLGGALAVLSALRTPCPNSNCITFACPRVGDAEFAAQANAKCDWTRYEMHHDLVTRLPPRKLGFAPAGKRHVILRDGKITPKPELIRENNWNFDPKLNLFDHSPVLYATHLYNAMLKNE